MPGPTSDSGRLAGHGTGQVSRAVVLGSGSNPTLPSVERTVNELIVKAHRSGASDIHIEPNPDHLLVRARIDGSLQPIDRVPIDQMKQVIARLKIMANADPNEGRMPTDGRFPMGRFDPTAKELDIRATFVPSFFGEKVVLRLIDHSKLKLSLDELGFSPENARLYQQILARPSGLILHVGPQGCGKTTTAYAALKNTPRPNASVVTVEETVEYVLPGVTQVQVDESLTYSRALQAVMRQDPDVILVSELRDADTARLAIEGAMSGRLVVSTVHANSASGAVARLTDLGLSRGQVAHALAGIISQRLVRRLCVECRERIAPSTLIRSALSLPPQVTAVWKPRGCRKCGGKGFRGRLAVFEVIATSDRVREAIAAGAQTHQIESIAVSEGTVPLLRDAVDKITQGATAVEEVLRSLCGVSVDDVGAITEPGEMVTFLKMVRDQFLPVPGAPAPPIAAPAPAPPPPPAPTRSPTGSQHVRADVRADVSSRYRPPSSAGFVAPTFKDDSGAPQPQPVRPPSGVQPALTNRYQPTNPARPPSDQFRIRAEDYRPAPAPPPAPTASYQRDQREGSSSYARPTTVERSNEEVLRSLMQTLPPDVAASIARAAGAAASGPPPPVPAPVATPQTTQRVNPNELLKQLQELQRRLMRPSDSG